MPRRALQFDPRLGPYLSVGLHTLYNAQTDNDLTRSMDAGGGFSLGFGFRVSRATALEVAFDHSWMGSSNSQSGGVGVLDGLTFDVLLFPMPSSTRIEPFLDLGAGLYRFDRTDYAFFGSELSGAGFHAGGGVQVRFSDLLGVTLRGRYRGAYVSNHDYVVSQPTSAYFNQLMAELALKVFF
jgi:hypothetical protein